MVKNIMMAFVLVSTAVVSSAETKKKSPASPVEICDFLLGRVSVEFMQRGLFWEKGDSGHVSEIVLGARGRNRESIAVTLESDSRIAIPPIQMFTRLDALILDNKEIFYPSVVSARVNDIKGPKALVKVESEDFDGEIELKNDVRHFVLPAKPTQAQDRVLIIEAHIPSRESNPALTLTISHEKKYYQVPLNGEVSSLIYLASRKIGLQAFPSSLAERVEDIAKSTFKVAAGSHNVDPIDLKLQLPDHLSIGKDYSIVGLGEFDMPALNGATTVFFLKNKSTGHRFAIPSYSSSEGLEILEAAIANVEFDVNVLSEPGQPTKILLAR